MFAASHKFHFYEFVEKVIFNASVLLALRSSVRFCDTVIVRIVMAGGGVGGGWWAWRGVLFWWQL